MSNKRKEIRDEIKSLLDSDVSLVSDSNIYAFRVNPIFEEIELPCICIFTKSEKYETLNSSPKHLDAELDLSIEIYVKGSSGIDDSLDDLSNEVMNSLLKTENENNDLWNGLDIDSTEMAFTDEGLQPMGVARMNFVIKYDFNYI